jgi:hypothetical protein
MARGCDNLDRVPCMPIALLSNFWQLSLKPLSKRRNPLQLSYVRIFPLANFVWTLISDVSSLTLSLIEREDETRS